ncbi:hypothetical protein HK101_010362 [Irineochytrium annulatum]|nr:hypothetical protein HK101_010362 [Irineochytrium annulatum]
MSSAIPMTTAALTAVACVLALIVLFRAFRARKDRIPGPFALPIIGNASLVLKYSGKFHLLRDVMTKAYGRIYRIVSPATGRQIVFTSDVDCAKRIFAGDNFTRSGRAQWIVEDMFRTVLFIMPTDADWRKHRKFLQPGFGPTHLRQALEATDTVTGELLSIWDQRLAANAETDKPYVTDIYHVASSLTIDVIGLVAFSYRYNCIPNHEEPEALKTMKAYQSVFEVISQRFGTPRIFWRYRGVGARQVVDRVGVMKAAVRDAIASKREAMKARHAGGEEG